MENITEAEFDRVVGINIKGCFFAISSVVPIMKKQEPKGGSIVVVGSDQSFIGKPFQNLYGMTKGAIAQLAKSCAVQYAPEGIRVNCVCPGTIDTPLMRKAVEHMTDLAGDGDVEGRVKWLETAQPYPRLGQPEEVAHVRVGDAPTLCTRLACFSDTHPCCSLILSDDCFCVQDAIHGWLECPDRWRVHGLLEGRAFRAKLYVTVLIASLKTRRSTNYARFRGALLFYSLIAR